MGGNSGGSPNTDNLGVTEYSTYANRPSQYTPYGSSVWEQDGTWTHPINGQKYPKWVQRQTVNPWKEKAIEYGEAAEAKKNALSFQFAEQAYPEFINSQRFDGAQNWATGYDPQHVAAMDRTYGPNTQGLDPAQVYANQATGAYTELGNERAAQRGDTGDIRNQAEDALYSRSTARLDPQWEQARTQRRTELANRGLRPGDPLYDRQMQEFNRGKGEAYEAARNNAVSGGGAEASRQFGMQSQARQQDLDQYLREGQFGNQALQQIFSQGQAANAAQRAQRTMGWQERMQQAELQNRMNQSYWQSQMAGSNQLFNQGQQWAQSRNQLRQAQIAEAMGQRASRLNEIQAFTGGNQVGMFSQPSFVPSQTAQMSQGGAGGGSGGGDWGQILGMLGGAGAGFMMGGPPGAAAGGLFGGMF